MIELFKRNIISLSNKIKSIHSYTIRVSLLINGKTNDTHVIRIDDMVRGIYQMLNHASVMSYELRINDITGIHLKFLVKITTLIICIILNQRYFIHTDSLKEYCRVQNEKIEYISYFRSIHLLHEMKMLQMNLLFNSKLMEHIKKYLIIPTKYLDS